MKLCICNEEQNDNVNTQWLLRDDWNLWEHDCGTVIDGPEEVAFIPYVGLIVHIYECPSESPVHNETVSFALKHTFLGTDYCIMMCDALALCIEVPTFQRSLLLNFQDKVVTNIHSVMRVGSHDSNKDIE
jgi:hypothetical protein